MLATQRCGLILRFRDQLALAVVCAVDSVSKERGLPNRLEGFMLEQLATIRALPWEFPTVLLAPDLHACENREALATMLAGRIHR